MRRISGQPNLHFVNQTQPRRIRAALNHSKVSGTWKGQVARGTVLASFVCGPTQTLWHELSHLFGAAITGGNAKGLWINSHEHPSLTFLDYLPGDFIRVSPPTDAHQMHAAGMAYYESSGVICSMVSAGMPYVASFAITTYLLTSPLRMRNLSSFLIKAPVGLYFLYEALQHCYGNCEGDIEKIPRSLGLGEWFSNSLVGHGIIGGTLGIAGAGLGWLAHKIVKRLRPNGQIEMRNFRL